MRRATLPDELHCCPRTINTTNYQQAISSPTPAPDRMPRENTLSSLEEQTRRAGRQMSVRATICWIFQHPLSPYSHCTRQKVGKIQLFLARAICSHSRQLFPAALAEFSVIVSTPSLLCCHMQPQTVTQREKITERFRNTSLGQTVNGTAAQITKSTINRFCAKSFEFCKHFVLYKISQLD